MAARPTGPRGLLASRLAVVVALGATCTLAGCGTDGGSAASGSTREDPPSAAAEPGGSGGPSASPAPAAPSTADPSTAGPVRFDRALHDELMGMYRRDQRERRTGMVGEGDQVRTDRLEEILDEHGWPTISLVGEDGADAAWTIAQHADLDPAFQARALELLRAAAAAGEASPGNLAYLEDRVAVAQGRPQTYGTQIRCADGAAEPATPIEEPGGVEARRAAAGLEPLADYQREMDAICAQGG